MNITVLDGYTLNPGDLEWDGFKELGRLTVYDRTPNETELIIERSKNAEILITNKTHLNRVTIENLPVLRYIGVLATGYDVVDIEAAGEKGIPVTNIPTYATNAVAQMTFALLLELCDHVGSHNESVKSGVWCNCSDFCYLNAPITDLCGKTMGIIGFGNIGKAVSRIASAFGMNVLVYTPHPGNPEIEPDIKFAPLDYVFELSDVISLHCPLTQDTKWIINEKTIAGMKSGVLIINTSRGPLINEEELADALGSGKVQGAALDVVSSEPILPSNPLLNAPNCILTPHIAWASFESRNRLLHMAVDNLKYFLDGKPVNVVNSHSMISTAS